MDKKNLLRSKYFLYATEFFAGMSVMAIELGASRLLAPYFSSSQKMCIRDSCRIISKQSGSEQISIIFSAI